MNQQYAGWVVVEEAGEGMKPLVLVEWIGDNGERKREHMKSRGESGCVEAIEWWDTKLGKPAMLEATIRGMYRVKK